MVEAATGLLGSGRGQQGRAGPTHQPLALPKERGEPGEERARLLRERTCRLLEAGAAAAAAGGP